MTIILRGSNKRRVGRLRKSDTELYIKACKRYPLRLQGWFIEEPLLCICKLAGVLTVRIDDRKGDIQYETDLQNFFDFGVSRKKSDWKYPKIYLQEKYWKKGKSRLF